MNTTEPGHAVSDRQKAVIAPLIRINLVGQMAVWADDDRSILPTGRKTRALLAVLALSAPRPMLRSRLTEMLWSRRPEEQARAALRQELHRLLEAMEPVGRAVLLIARDHLALRPETAAIDVDETLRNAGTDPSVLAALRGDLLEDLDGLDPVFDAWLASERQRFGDRTRLLGESLLHQENSFDGLIHAAQRLLGIDPTHEGGWRALMQGYQAAGEHGLALQAYQRCAAVLAKEVDAEPSPATRALMEAIRASSPNLTRTAGTRDDWRMPTPAIRTEPPRPAPLAPPAPPRPVVAATPPRRRSLNPGGGPALCVRPLQPLGRACAPEEAAAISEAITASLLRFRWLGIMSASLLYAVPTLERDGSSTRPDLDYILEGTIQRGSRTLRICLQLLDKASEGRVAWAHRLDVPSGDPLDEQDRIAARISATLERELLFLESRRPLEDAPTAYEQTLRAAGLMGRLEPGPFARAGALLQEASYSASDRAAPQCWRAAWLLLNVEQGWAAEAKGAIDEAYACAARGVATDPGDGRAMGVLAQIRGRGHGRPGEALTLIERATRLNPNLAMVAAEGAVMAGYLGRPTLAQSYLDRLATLDPLKQDVLPTTASMTVAFLRRDWSEVARLGQEASETRPHYRAAQAFHFAALGHLGDVERAARLARRLPDAGAGSVAELSRLHPFVRDADRISLQDGLRAAGLI